MSTDDHPAKCLRCAEVELQDLQTYWKSLCWWERESSLHHVSELLADIQEPNYTFRFGLARDIAAELSTENESDYPAAADTDIVLMGSPRFDRESCNDLLNQLSDENIMDICTHVGLEHAEDLRISLVCAMARSQAVFFAIRNKTYDLITKANGEARISGR